MKTKLALFAIAVTFAVALAAQNPPAEPSLQGQGTLKVMTYNTYVGTEYVGLTNPSLPVFLQAVTNMLQEAVANDPQGRAQAIARQIAETRPVLVSLQEVATFSTGPTKDNLTVQIDSLQLLLDALAALGTPYIPVVSFETWGATFPSSTGLYIRNTWRIAIIARADLKPEDLSFTNVQPSTWSPAATLSYRIPALDGSADCPVPLTGSLCIMPFPRGWASVDVRYRDKQFRYINVHLESRSTSRNILEGIELLNGPANTSLPVIVAGDFNCDLSNPSDPKYPTCLNFLDHGFVDAWTVASPPEPGYTKPLFPLDNPGATMTQRGDYVMVRGRFKVQAAVLVGEEVGDMTSTGLWPSNHCGVVARLQHPGEE